MLTIHGIDHIVLRTTQLANMLTFYCDVLGCLIERETSPSLGLTQLRAGNALIDLVDVNSELGKMGGQAPKPKGNNLDHFCLQIATISHQALIAHLDKHQVQHGQFEQRYGANGFGLSIYLCDPDGNTIELRSKESLSEST